MLVKALGTLITGVDDQRPRGDDHGCPCRALDCILQQSSTCGLPLIASINCKLAQQRAWNGIGGVSAHAANKVARTRNGAGAQRIVLSDTA